MTNTNDREALGYDENTLGKVYEAMGEAGIEAYQAQDAVNLMQNRGILFRERMGEPAAQPHVVETVEELKALSPGTPLRFANGDVSIASHGLSYYPDAVDEAQLGRDLPATVLVPATQPTASGPTEEQITASLDAWKRRFETHPAATVRENMRAALTAAAKVGGE